MIAPTVSPRTVRTHAQSAPVRPSRFGVLTVRPEHQEYLRRFLRKVDLPVRLRQDCWIWTGGVDRRGYGRFKFMGSLRQAHRVVLEMAGCSIPDGWVVDHLCDNPSCVSPWHVEPTTHLHNVYRSEWFQKTHCTNGHEYTPENTYTDPRGCSRYECQNERARARRAA